MQQGAGAQQHGARPGAHEAGREGRPSAGPDKNSGDKVYDAEYEVVDDERKAG